MTIGDCTFVTRPLHYYLWKIEMKNINFYTKQINNDMEIKYF